MIGEFKATGNRSISGESQTGLPIDSALVGSGAGKRPKDRALGSSQQCRLTFFVGVEESRGEVGKAEVEERIDGRLQDGDKFVRQLRGVENFAPEVRGANPNVEDTVAGGADQGGEQQIDFVEGADPLAERLGGRGVRLNAIGGRKVFRHDRGCS